MRKPRLGYWDRFKIWWTVPRAVVAIVAVFVLIGFITGAAGSLSQGNTFGEFVGDLYANVSTEMVSIGITVAITVLIIDQLYQRRETAREKRDLILQMGSPDNAFAREAVRQLRAQGWGFGNDNSLRGADLRKANLQEATLWEANLQEAYLAEANLQKANLWEANLQEANLIFANLQRAQLEYANLQAANLGSANLQGASPARVNLQEADLTNANLRYAPIFDDQLAKANRLKAATLPDGTRYDGRFNLAGDIENARADGVNTDDPAEMARWYAGDWKRPEGHSPASAPQPKPNDNRTDRGLLLAIGAALLIFSWFVVDAIGKRVQGKRV